MCVKHIDMYLFNLCMHVCGEAHIDMRFINTPQVCNPLGICVGTGTCVPTLCAFIYSTIYTHELDSGQTWVTQSKLGKHLRESNIWKIIFSVPILWPLICTNI